MTGARLPAKFRKAANKALYRLTFNTYFDGIPLGAINGILKANGCELIDEAWLPWTGIICGAEGRTEFLLGTYGDGIGGFPWKAPMEDGLPDLARTPVKNAQLILSWYKMPSGRYEIVAYVG
jgi:hypothetical protein